MLDLGSATPEQRLDYLRAAANFSGGAVFLILQQKYLLSEEEETAWVEALSDAADQDATPRSLLIKAYGFNPSNTLRALKKGKVLTHLFLQECLMSDECVDVLSPFISLTTLHLHLQTSIHCLHNFASRLADLHPSHSALAASLHRLYIISDDSIDWGGRSTGFLHHWPQLKELTLKAYNQITKEEIINCDGNMDPNRDD